jgi:hypothetical protein
LGLIVSPIAGRDGNHEYLLWLAPARAEMEQPLAGDVGERAIAQAVAEALSGAESES